MVEKSLDVKALTSEIVRTMNENSRRIRVIEQRTDRLENSISATEKNILTQMGDLKVGIESIGEKITTLGSKLATIESEILRINKELSKTASKAEVKQLEMFIDLINPITSKFITRDELERIIEERMKKA